MFARRSWLILPLLPLAACAPEPLAATAVALGGASLVFTGKTPLDHVAGWASGQDCSAVRWERHGPWCVAPSGPPPPAPICTRSLGAVDCWLPRDAAPAAPAPPPAAGEGERPLTPGS